MLQVISTTFTSRRIYYKNNQIKKHKTKYLTTLLIVALTFRKFPESSTLENKKKEIISGRQKME